MEPQAIESFFTSDVMMALLVGGVSLLAVLVPFTRGLQIALQGFVATRSVSLDEIERDLAGGATASPSVVLQMLQVMQRALGESQRETCPADFVVDASRQYVSHAYETQYAQPIGMCANILPPIGFIGTTGGLLVLFVSMQIGSDSLELGALAAALTSSIFALLGFAILEGLKFRLYRRLLDRLSDAVDHAPLAAAMAA